MAKEKPKVQSLEEVAQELLVAEPQPSRSIPLMESQSSVPKSLKKHKSMCATSSGWTLRVSS